jgi:hypothetical protein
MGKPGAIGCLLGSLNFWYMHRLFSLQKENKYLV